MRWERHNVNPMLVLRNAVCNRRWQETWQTSRAELRTLRTSQREADSHQRLTSACWTLALLGSAGVSGISPTLSRLLPHPRLWFAKSHLFVALALVILGANPFSGALRPPLQV